MDTRQINNRLRNTPGFLGTFARDRVPKNIRAPASFVFNTDVAAKPGRHWIAVFISETSIEYFDPAGHKPVLTSFLRRQAKPVLYNNFMIQDPDSFACGLFAIDFILRRSAGESFNEILSSFSRNTILNDFLVAA